jgi:signal transduction histidine kinase
VRNGAKEGEATSRGSRTISLQTLLVMLPALATLPLIAFALWLLHLVWQNGQAEARRDLQQMATTLAVALDREVAGSIRELQRIAEFPTLVEQDLMAFHAYARELVARNDGWDNVAVIDRGGAVVLNVALPFVQRPDILVDLPHIRATVETGRPQVSDVFHSGPTGERAIGVAVPVMRGGEVGWVLTARLSYDALSRFVGEQLYRDGALASVADRQLRIVARSREAARFFGHPVTDDLRAALAASPERGTRRLVTLDGAAVLAAWERMPSGWTITIGVPVGVFDGPLQRSFGGLLAFGLVVLALGVVLSLMLGRRISATIDAVAADARSLADAEPIAERRSSIRQVSTLFASLREASGMQRDKEQAREQAVEALREADRRKDEFLAMLAHELRNPLAPLRNAMSVLSRTLPGGTPQRLAVEMSDRQVRRLTRLVDDLLDVSRITQGKIALHREPVSIADAVADAAEVMRPAIEARRQRLALRLPDTAPVVLADGVRLAQVFENLLSNASKYTDLGGEIEVEVEDAPDAVRVRVRDTGIGLPPDQLERVFELFTQVDSSRDRAQGGLGIGLSLVRQLVELHGGTVSASSDGPGRGACFVVALPRGSASVATATA